MRQFSFNILFGNLLNGLYPDTSFGFRHLTPLTSPLRIQWHKLWLPPCIILFNGHRANDLLTFCAFIPHFLRAKSRLMYISIPDHNNANKYQVLMLIKSPGSHIAIINSWWINSLTNNNCDYKYSKCFIHKSYRPPLNTMPIYHLKKYQ